jgi:hypothetical protein
VEGNVLMKKEAKKILLIIMKDGARYTYSIPKEKSHIDVYKYSLDVEGIDVNEVKKVLYFPNTLYDMEEVQYYYNEEGDNFDEKSIAIDFKIDEFRKQRSVFFKALDMEFMKSLEKEDCDECTRNITKIKNHMRGLPDMLVDYLQGFSIKEITSFNCFNNVYDIILINGGSGYVEAPSVTVSPPEESGIQMEAEAIVLEGKVVKIEITRAGSGYSETPSVNLSKPTSGNVAFAVASSPENDILNLTQ